MRPAKLIFGLACGLGLGAFAYAAMAQTAAAMAFAPGDGQAQTVAACAACHPPAMVTGKRYSADKWAEVVDQMINKGAKVSDADYDVIVAYLTRSYGTGKPDGPASLIYPGSDAGAGPRRH